MPRKNSLKVYVKDGFYHVYNRGVEKRIIYEDEQDYSVFLSFLKYALSEPPKKDDVIKTFTLQGLPFKGVPRLPKTFQDKIELHAYCLMPNHFHLIIKQLDDYSIRNFMISLITRYSMYFNKKYDRVGSLFQGVYRAVMITEEPYLLHLSRYVHLNPSEFRINLTLAHSSYADYVGLRHTSWVKSEPILREFSSKASKDFKNINSYKDFVEKYKQGDKLILGDLTLD